MKIIKKRKLLFKRFMNTNVKNVISNNGSTIVECKRKKLNLISIIRNDKNKVSMDISVNKEEKNKVSIDIELNKDDNNFITLKKPVIDDDDTLFLTLHDDVERTNNSIDNNNNLDNNDLIQPKIVESINHDLIKEKIDKAVSKYSNNKTKKIIVEGSDLDLINVSNLEKLQQEANDSVIEMVGISIYKFNTLLISVGVTAIGGLIYYKYYSGSKNNKNNTNNSNSGDGDGFVSFLKKKVGRIIRLVLK